MRSREPPIPAAWTASQLPAAWKEPGAEGSTEGVSLTGTVRQTERTGAGDSPQSGVLGAGVPGAGPDWAERGGNGLYSDGK